MWFGYPSKVDHINRFSLKVSCFDGYDFLSIHAGLKLLYVHHEHNYFRDPISKKTGVFGIWVLKCF